MKKEIKEEEEFIIAPCHRFFPKVKTWRTIQFLPSSRESELYELEKIFQESDSEDDILVVSPRDLQLSSLSFLRAALEAEAQKSSECQETAEST